MTHSYSSSSVLVTVNWSRSSFQAWHSPSFEKTQAVCDALQGQHTKEKMLSLPRGIGDVWSLKTSWQVKNLHGVCTFPTFGVWIWTRYFRFLNPSSFLLNWLYYAYLSELWWGFNEIYMQKYPAWEWSLLFSVSAFPKAQIHHLPMFRLEAWEKNSKEKSLWGTCYLRMLGTWIKAAVLYHSKMCLDVEVRVIGIVTYALDNAQGLKSSLGAQVGIIPMRPCWRRSSILNSKRTAKPLKQSKEAHRHWLISQKLLVAGNWQHLHR